MPELASLTALLSFIEMFRKVFVLLVQIIVQNVRQLENVIHAIHHISSDSQT